MTNYLNLFLIILKHLKYNFIEKYNSLNKYHKKFTQLCEQKNNILNGIYFDYLKCIIYFYLNTYYT